MSRSGLQNVVEYQQVNAVLGWMLFVFLLLVAVAGLFTDELLWSAFTFVVASLAIVPAVVYRNPRIMLPWEVVALASLPMLGQVLIEGQRVGGITLTGRVTTYLAVAAVALIIAVELDEFTEVRMNYSFAVLFVVVATMAAAGVWAVAQWLSDLYLGTAFLVERMGADPETQLMWDFVAATVAGTLAGLLFEFYFRRRRKLRTARTDGESPTDGELRTDGGPRTDGRSHAEGPVLRKYLHLDAHRQRQLSRAMQLALVGLLFIGFERQNLGIIVNAGVALAITHLPATLERDYHIPMNAGLTLWITTAVFLHALGTVGIPGNDSTFYTSVWWWDHLTHALSASIVAAVGYTAARGIDQHTDAVVLPPKFMFVFILLFVVAFGVFWEVIEFAVSQLAAAVGSGTVLTQYGLRDTMLDLLFDIVGGVFVALWGEAHLTNVVGAVTARLDRT